MGRSVRRFNRTRYELYYVMNSHSHNTIITRLISLSFALAGLLLLVNSSAGIDWVETEGVVKACTIRRSNQVVNPTQPRARDTKERFTPSVTYHFKDQKTFKDVLSKKVFNTKHHTWQEAEEIRARFPVGSAVTVYYNPKNPRHSVLQLNAVDGLQMSGYFFLISAAGIFLYSFKRKLSDSST